MDRLDELAVLVAVVDHGSLVAAARRLRRSPPAITRALSALENRVGARLVERTTRRISSTEAGRALAESSRALLDAYDAAVTGISHAPVRGLVRVTAPVQFGRRHMAPLVASFLNEFPNTQVDLVLHDRNLDLIGEGLTNRQIAERMFLAEKTVKNYVSNILMKLGLSRRAEAAAFMARRSAGKRQTNDWS